MQISPTEETLGPDVLHIGEKDDDTVVGPFLADKDSAAAVLGIPER